MNCSTNNFGRSGPADSGELKAIMFALLSCFLFITFLTVVHRRATRSDRRISKIRSHPPPEPVMPVAAPEIAEPPPPDMYTRFREVPPNFRGISFVTRSYGNYQLSDGTNRDLVLVDGRFRVHGESQHWFDLNDVQYTDLTGDESPEAIVVMTHLECDRMCDGGKSLVYVYSRDNGVMNEILKYESGSGIQGCSLKSLTVKKKQLTLDSFGKCPPPPGIIDDFIRRDTYDLTRVEFFFNGNELVPKKKTFLTLPNRGEVSDGVVVRIDDDRTPDL